MADQWSNHFATSQPGLTLDRSRHKAPAGMKNANTRFDIIHVTLDLSPSAFTDGDVCRLTTLNSNERIVSIRLAAVGDSGTTAASLGIYNAGTNHDGAVIDVDLFGAGLAIAGGIAFVDEFAAGALENEDRGKQLWELVNEGIAASTYDADTNAEWDLALTSTATLDTADEPVVVVVEKAIE